MTAAVAAAGAATAAIATAQAAIAQAAGDLASYISSGVTRDPAKPFITSYDDRTGERVELSYATFANWVWKSANYLRDSLDVQPGDEVAVLLRTHWQTIAIWYAGFAAGAVVVPLTVKDLAGSKAVAVFAQEDTLPAVLAAGVAPGAVVGLSLRPMAGRLAATHAGAEDYASEVPAHGDSFTPAALVPLTALALPGRSGAAVLAGAKAAAAHLRLAAADRVLCTAEIVTADAFVATVLAVFDAGAGIVLAPDADPDRLERRCAEELVTVHVAG